MKVLAIICFLVASFSPVYAQFGSSNQNFSTGDLLKQVAVATATRFVEKKLNQREEVRPMPVGVKLPRLVVSCRNCWCSEDIAAVMAESSLHQVGFQVISRRGREAVKREMYETQGREFNQSTAQPFGTLDGSELYSVINVSEGNGPERSIDLRQIGRSYFSAGEDTREVWARVNIQLLDSTGIILSNIACEAPDSATSVNLVLGWFSNVNYRSYQPNRRDLAIAAAMTRAANQVGREAATKVAGWQFDPATGRALCAPAARCIDCQKTIPADARFCPYCGRKFK